MVDPGPIPSFESGTVNTHSTLLKIVNILISQALYSDVVAKLKLKVTKDSEAIRELLCMTNGVPYRPTTITRRLGGSFIGIKEANQAKQITELLKRFTL